ncbi:class E sortase [Candidatus Saccharibacteria bacterium]|nr:class E sortase [Candidatus Saccharibacteria bacterium]
MLRIQKRRLPNKQPFTLSVFAILLLGVGGYLLTLIAAPTIAPIISMKAINVNSLPAPQIAQDRIVIPKIGVDIAFGEGEQSLDNGAQWRYPDRGNPETGGNFIIAAHRFTLAATPNETVRKSPFYHIDKLALGDKIVIDYAGVRYGYEITDIFDVSPNQVEIEAPSTNSKLTLYSCELGGAEIGRVVLTAKPLGQVLVKS